MTVFHTTASGAIAPCQASARSCPLAPVEEHYSSTAEASRALALEALERQEDFVLILPPEWGKLVTEPAPEPQRTLPSKPSRAASSLTVEDFAAFRASAANRPNQVREDWREDLAAKARENGDLDADENPNSELVFGGYWDASE